MRRQLPHRTGRRTHIPARVLTSILADMRMELTLDGHWWQMDQACWIPTGSTNNRGYKRRSWMDGGRYWHLFTHQIMARLVHMAGAALPEGAEVHHVCQNTECCNPMHLRIMTPHEHARLHQCSA